MRYKTPERSKTATTEPDATQSPEGLVNERLNEDVACCLGDIDAALEESEAEHEAMIERRTQEKLAAEKDYYANYRGRELAWQERYAHLGATITHSYCEGTVLVFSNVT